MRKEMHRGFRDKLVEAAGIREVCRRTGDIGPHAEQMVRMIEYGREHQCLQGSVLDGTASPEALAQAAESAAFILDVIHGEERVGSTLNLSEEQKRALVYRAKERAEQHIKDVREAFGADPMDPPF